MTFVWVGQGFIGTVMLWTPLEVADRIRSGDVICDLLRPINPVLRELAGELGRAVYGAATRFVILIAVGALAFDLFTPDRPATYLIFVVSVALAVVVCFGCRYLVAAASYWLLDARGPQLLWSLGSVVLSGMAFPLWFLPGWGSAALIFGTPLPSVIQLPVDILAERAQLPGQLRSVALQAAWAVIMLWLCHVVQGRAERRMVIQGG